MASCSSSESPKSSRMEGMGKFEGSGASMPKEGSKAGLLASSGALAGRMKASVSALVPVGSQGFAFTDCKSDKSDCLEGGKRLHYGS